MSADDQNYDGHIEPSLLDIIQIDFLAKSPHLYQTENHQIDDRYYWRLVRKAQFAEALQAVDPVQTDLWGLSTDQSFHGKHDRLNLANTPFHKYSLRLIHVKDFRIRVSAEKIAFGDMEKKVRGYFTYASQSYALMITDPIISTKYSSCLEGFISIDEALLCVSLGEPFQEYAYKLIAGVILPP